MKKTNYQSNGQMELLIHDMMIFFCNFRWSVFVSIPLFHFQDAPHNFQPCLCIIYLSQVVVVQVFLKLGI